MKETEMEKMGMALAAAGCAALGASSSSGMVFKRNKPAKADDIVEVPLGDPSSKYTLDQERTINCDDFSCRYIAGSDDREAVCLTGLLTPGNPQPDISSFPLIVTEEMREYIMTPLGISPFALSHTEQPAKKFTHIDLNSEQAAQLADLWLTKATGVLYALTDDGQPVQRKFCGFFVANEGYAPWEIVLDGTPDQRIEQADLEQIAMHVAATYRSPA